MGETDETGRQPEPAQQTHEAEPLTPVCASCGGFPAWESLTDHWGERWLATCDCGRIDTFFPDRRHPDQQPAEPLAMFLQGHRAPRRPATPAWQRVFLRSVEPPLSVSWRRCPSSCPDCDVEVSFACQAWPRPGIHAICTLCLNCGYVTASYRPWQGGEETLTCGAAWTPACPAVQRFRECVFRPFASATSAPSQDGEG